MGVEGWGRESPDEVFAVEKAILRLCHLRFLPVAAADLRIHVQR